VGPASLAGKLALTFDAGAYGPHIYPILTGAPVSGTFSSVAAAGSPGEAFGIAYTASQADLVTEPIVNAQAYGDVSAATLDRAQDFASLVEDRFGDAGCADGTPGKDAVDCGGFGAWAQVIGQTDHLSGSPGSAGFTNNGGGVIGGIDRQWEGGSQIGGAFGYAQNSLDMGAVAARASGPSYYEAIYGRLALGPAWLDGQAFYMHSGWSLSRTVAGFGVATSTPNSNTEGLLAEISAPIAGGDLRPYARFAYARTTRDETTELGVGPLGYTIDSGSATSALAEVGALYTHTFTTAGGSQVRPGLQVGVQDNVGDRSQLIAGNLFGVVGSGFTQSAARLPDVAGLVDASLKVKLNSQFELFGDVRGRFASGQTDATASIGGVFKF
jgi:outer membrane autotransporter protein